MTQNAEQPNLTATATAGIKAALRRQCLAARDALDVPIRQARSARICACAASLPMVANARCIALYAPMGSEVDIAPLVDRLRAEGRTVALPRIRPDKHLDFVAVDGWAKLALGPMGIRQSQGEALPIAQLDLIVAPGIAFDGSGHRLGYGGGYYDRTLLGYNGVVVGVAFAQQILASLPFSSHDRAVHGVVCELGFRPGTRRT